ncbi:MAG TPA: response regulator transcription factor [Longimicrobium sp.]|nr:response regulator transcription factor [Longimicrobium sp.]
MRVVVAASSPVVAAGLEAVVAAGGRHQATRCGVLATEVAEAVRAVEPDVLVVELGTSEDLPLPVRLGTESLARSLPVVVVMDRPGPAWVMDAMRLGLHAALPRDVTAEELVAAVEGAAAGLFCMPIGLAMVLVSGAAEGGGQSEPLGMVLDPGLSPREADVLQLLARGISNKAIARELGISEHTVKAHVGAVFGKLGVSTRAEAVAVGVRSGLLML